MLHLSIITFTDDKRLIVNKKHQNISYTWILWKYLAKAQKWLIVTGILAFDCLLFENLFKNKQTNKPKSIEFFYTWILFFWLEKPKCFCVCWDFNLRCSAVFATDLSQYEPTLLVRNFSIKQHFLPNNLGNIESCSKITYIMRRHSLYQFKQFNKVR